jgi:hypothetical protein
VTQRRHGVWRCLCGCELYARPTKGSKRHHDQYTAYAPTDSVKRWTYDKHNDMFLHMHSGRIGLLKADFVEDRDAVQVHDRESDQ